MAPHTHPSDSVIDQLPLPGQRWVASRKAAVIEAVRAGKLSLREACRRYELCPDEFNSWATAIDKHGVPGLRAMRFQIYRDNPRRQVLNSAGTIEATSYSLRSCSAGVVMWSLLPPLVSGAFGTDG